MADRDIHRDIRQDVSDVLVRYATAIDRRDWALFRTCFTADCHADYGDIGVWDGLDAITEFMEKSHAALGHTLHRITNQAIARTDCGASARSYVDLVALTPDGRGGISAVGYYDDELVEADRGWKIARRRYTMVRLSPFAAS